MKKNEYIHTRAQRYICTYTYAHVHFFQVIGLQIRKIYNRKNTIQSFI